MDKAKIKTKLQDMETFLTELVAAGLLDGDQRIKILFDLTVREITKELEKEEPTP